MKNIKTFLIGFLTAICLFFIMGFKTQEAAGTYQLVVTDDNNFYIFNTKVGLFAAYFSDQEGQHVVNELDKIMLGN